MTEGGKFLPKGPMAEEVLRDYFLSLGYYVVRGIEIKYAGKSITDIDLWLYSRSTAVAREITNVDIKNKKRPTVAERIMWAKGVAAIYKFNRCIVVSSTQNDETRSFGKIHDVQVITKKFIDMYIDSAQKGMIAPHIYEEDLKAPFKAETFFSSRETFLSRLQVERQLLVDSLNFYGCNQHLQTIHQLFEYYLITTNKVTCLRFLYLTISYFLITLDFISKDITFMDKEERMKILHEGFNFGDGGEKRAKEILDLATNFAVNSIPAPSLFSADEIRHEVQSQIEQFPKHFAEYFSGRDVMNRLFAIALEFNKNAYEPAVPEIVNLNSETKSIIAVMCDFWGLDRTIFLN